MNDITSTQDKPMKDIDNSLQRYFRSEMPNPWPQAPEVSLTTAPAAREVSLWQTLSRYVSIAAVLALLILGYWAVSGQFQNGSAAPGVGQGMTPEATIGSNDLKVRPLDTNPMPQPNP
jgi:hypothetical protein